MSAVLCIYLSVALICFIAALCGWIVEIGQINGSQSDLRDASRLVFLAPLWPALLIFFCVKLWRDADWFGGGR